MPAYLYEHPETGAVVEVIQRMTEPHIFIDPFGVSYRRVFTTPRMSVDSQCNPFSQEDFLRHTNKRMTIGEMMDVSADLSEKRAKKVGKDPLKEKMFSDYKKRTKKEHPFKIKNQRVETKDYIIEA